MNAPLIPPPRGLFGLPLLRLAPENTKFGFMRFRRVSYPLSAVLSIISVLMFLFVGMNFGIDFAGGTQVELRAKSGEAQIHDIRTKAEGLGLGPVEVQGNGRPATPQPPARRQRRRADGGRQAARRVRRRLRFP
jgi:preprotein translocase subunit SecF